MEYFSSTTLIAMSLIFVGSYVQTAIGFGLAIVAAPLLFSVSPDYVPAPILICAFFISLLNAMKLRSDISIGGLKMALIGRVPGSILGGFILVMVSSDTLSIWLGLLVWFAVAVSLLPYRIEPTPKRMAIAGFFSGLFGTSSSIGGPPMALLLQHQDANQLRGNLSAFFLFSSIISMVVQIPIGFMTFHHVMLSLPLIPAAWLGYVLARKTTHALPKEKIRIGALVLCLVSGTTAIWRSFM